MWEAYWQTACTNPLDWGIFGFGALLILAHIVGGVGRVWGQWVFFVQDLDRYRTVLLLLSELLPLLGLLGTVLSLMFTFKTFQLATAEEVPDLSHMVQTFAPALSTTISGLLMLIPNLVLNAFLWFACPQVEKG
jgi:hypothetical protein